MKNHTGTSQNLPIQVLPSKNRFKQMSRTHYTACHRPFDQELSAWNRTEDADPMCNALDMEIEPKHG
jgi:hypothetical protein